MALACVVRLPRRQNARPGAAAVPGRRGLPRALSPSGQFSLPALLWAIIVVVLAGQIILYLAHAAAVDLEPLDVIRTLNGLELGAVVLLDVARVGSGEGIDARLVEEAASASEHGIIVGGGRSVYFLARTCVGKGHDVTVGCRDRPDGVYLARRLKAVVATGQLYINWSIDSYDSHQLYTDPDVIYHNVIGSVHKGSVILLHQTHPESVAALPRICAWLKAHGYKMVTVSELAFYSKPHNYW